MAVDLGDLIESLKREVSPPGEFTSMFPNSTDDELLGNLQDGFWEVILDGLITGYSVDDNGLVTPNTGDTDLDRSLQQIVIFYSGIRIVRNHLRNMNTRTHSKAGPVEFDVEKSANTLRDLLKELKDRRNILLARLSDIGTVPSYYINAILSRQDSVVYGDDPFPSAGDSRF